MRRRSPSIARDVIFDNGHLSRRPCDHFWLPRGHLVTSWPPMARQRQPLYRFIRDCTIGFGARRRQPRPGNSRSAPFLVAPSAEAERGRGLEAHKASVKGQRSFTYRAWELPSSPFGRTMRRRDGTLNGGMGTATAGLLSASLHFGPTPLLRCCDSCASFRRKRAFLRGGYCCLWATWTTFGHNSVHGTAARTGQQLAGRGESRNFQVNGRNNARNVHGAIITLMLSDKHIGN
jgi:hypothetical protein